MTALPVTRVSLREAVNRRLVHIGLLLSAAFLALFAFGFNALYTRVADSVVSETELAVGATIMTVLGLYVVRFLAALLSIFLASSAVASEIDSGLLHAVLARPLSRTSWLAQRWLAFVLISVGYVTLMTGVVLAIASWIAGYAPLGAASALSIIALELAVLLSLGLLTSTTWSAVTSGVVTFSLFGVAWLAGIIELIGTELGNQAMRTAGIVTSLVIPSDALWRGASFYLQPASMLVLAGDRGGGPNPFAGSAPPTTALLIWSAAYAVVLLLVAAWRMRRRDL
ncbi:MAG TPA: ABC transporter permease subunit [Euzebyales bacterium]|nr:ABC transporter permease subunit [Euzebyales bacterium]